MRRRRLRLKLDQQSLDDGSAIGDWRSDQSLQRRRLASNPSSPPMPRHAAAALDAAP